MAKIRVLVVEDSPLIRHLVTEALEEDPEIEVAATAADGRLALRALGECRPDIVTLDVEMPVMDGLAALRELRKTHPRLPVIMFSTVTARGACATLDALALGANDYVTKPSKVANTAEGIQRVREQLIPKIKYFTRGRALPTVRPAPATNTTPDPPPAPARPRAPLARPVAVLAIAVSTGGPPALAELFRALPRQLSVPILITQHMPPIFTELLANRLNQLGGPAVREASDGMPVEAGCAYIAPGDFHAVVARQGARVVLRAVQSPPENSCRPSADVMFRSIAALYGDQVLAVVMTGMGHDGMAGCRSIREAGGQVLIQDEASSVVWGMPGAVSRAGLADATYPLAELAAQIQIRIPAPRPPALAQAAGDGR